MNARFTRGFNDLRKTYRSHDSRIRISGRNLACGSSASAGGVPEFCIAKRTQSKSYDCRHKSEVAMQGCVCPAPCTALVSYRANETKLRQVHLGGGLSA